MDWDLDDDLDGFDDGSLPGELDDAELLFALGLGAFLAGGLMGGEPRRRKRRKKY